MADSNNIISMLNNIVLGKNDMRAALQERHIQMDDDKISSYSGYINSIKDYDKQSITISQNGVTEVTKEQAGYNQVTVNVTVGEAVVEPLNVVANGVYEQENVSYTPVNVSAMSYENMDFLIDNAIPVSYIFYEDVEDFILVDRVKKI